MKAALAAAAVAAVVLAASTRAQEGPRRDGRWQVTVEMSMPGMPAGLPPMTMEQCITKEEAADPESMIPQTQGGRGAAPGDCQVTDQKISGSKVSWAMTCTGSEPMSGTGEFTYTDNGYTGVVKMDREGQTMTMKYSGKRLGDCAK